MQVHVVGPPEGGYSAFQAKVRWDPSAASYSPTQDAGDEALWPHCDIAGRSDNRFLTGSERHVGEPSVLFGCAPFPALAEASLTAGPVLELRFECQAEGNSPLALVSRPGDAQRGTHFLSSGGAEVDPTVISAQVTCGPCPNAGCPPPPPPVAASGNGHVGPTVPRDPPCLMADLSFQDGRTDFALGEPIEMTLSVTNCDTEPVEVGVCGNNDYVVYSKSLGPDWHVVQQYWRWSESSVYCNLTAESASLDPGDTASHTVEWDQHMNGDGGVPGQLVSPGEYRVSACNSVGCQVGKPSGLFATAQVTIRPDVWVPEPQPGDIQVDVQQCIELGPDPACQGLP
jgi:hypothetical protein